MRKDTKIIGAVIASIIVIFAALYVVRPEQLDGVMPWDEIDEAIDGFWKMDLWVNTTECQFYLSEMSTDSSLSITYGGSEVTEVAYVLLARAETPAGFDPWDIVELNFGSMFTVNGKIMNEAGSVTKWTDNVYTNSPGCESTGDTYLIPDATDYTQVFKWTIDIVSLANNYDPGMYRIFFDIYGIMEFRGGTNGIYGDTTYVELNNWEMNAIFEVVDDIVYGTNVVWDQDMEWTYA